MRNIETEFIWGQIFCTSMIMIIMTWSVVESKYFGFQKFRLTAMFLSDKIPFQIICKNWQGTKKFVFFSALGYLVFWGCNISPDSLKVVPVTALDARELFISDGDIYTTCSYSLLDVWIVMLIICLLVVVSSWSSLFLIHHSLPDSAGRGTTYNSILSTVWQCAGMGGGGCYWIPQGDRSCRSLDSDKNCKP